MIPPISSNNMTPISKESMNELNWPVMIMNPQINGGFPKYWIPIHIPAKDSPAYLAQYQWSKIRVSFNRTDPTLYEIQLSLVSTYMLLPHIDNIGALVDLVYILSGKSCDYLIHEVKQWETHIPNG